jgi:hypothetical protein
MKRILIWTAVLILMSTSAAARESKLTLHPAKIAEPAQKYHLLPRADKQTDVDAVLLYGKAIQSMPKGVDMEQIREWSKLPVEQFPQQQAEVALQKWVDSLRLVVRAARCKQCNWPEWQPSTQPENLSEYRRLAFALALWARLEICRGQYQVVLAAMQTAFGMAKQLGQAPTIIQAMVGMGVGAVMCREIEQFVQGKDSPNLYAALANLPEPLVDVEKAIENEKAVGLAKVKDGLVRKQLEEQMEPAHDRVRMVARRLDNHLNALQIVEAIRHYAATHDSQLPEKLSDVSQTEVPKDLMSDKPFEYRRTTAGATLRSAIPAGGEQRDAVHFEIVLQK